MKQILFRGAATALVTPMQPDGSLDLETLSRLTEWQIQSSIRSLVRCRGIVAPARETWK